MTRDEVLRGALKALEEEDKAGWLREEAQSIRARLNDRAHQTVESIQIDKARMIEINDELGAIMRNRRAILHEAFVLKLNR